MDSALQTIQAHLAFLKEQEGGPNHRLLYTARWGEAMDMLERWMRERGLAVRRDALGNLYGRIDGRSPGTVLLASHYDSVAGGGCYDGALGVISGLEAAAELYDRFGKPRYSLEVLAVCDEDGGRFKSSFLGSRAVTGTIGLSEIEPLADEAGNSFAEVRSGAGLPPLTESSLRACRRDDIIAAFELHCEQGRKLYDRGIPVGIVEKIAGQCKIKAVFHGEANHAGTTEMRHRRDALAAAAELVGFVRRLAVESGEGAVGTVGLLEVSPGATNIIPGKAMLIADLRNPDGTALRGMAERFEAECVRLADRDGLTVSVEFLCCQMPVSMDESLTGLLKSSAEELHIPYLPMFSGAGHDSQIFSAAFPAAMIFVPSEKGISHNPAEFTDPGSIEKGLELLKRAVYKTAYGDETTAG